VEIADNEAEKTSVGNYGARDKEMLAAANTEQPYNLAFFFTLTSNCFSSSHNGPSRYF
jgi:hypothetical protein